MKTGIIKAKPEGKRFGFIDINTGKDLFFHANDLVGVDFDELTIGTEVKFETTITPKGENAIKVQLVDEKQRTQFKPIEKKDLKRSDENSDYRFLNPYNFVRFLPEGKTIDEETRLLGRCEPQQHDRFSGRSGKITCTIQTITPLFIAGEIEEDTNKHKTAHFFKAGDQHLIPASSLRGMIRSMFEVVTNSCMDAFEYDDECGKLKDRLEYRYSKDPGLIPSRIIHLDKEGAKIEILNCVEKENIPKDIDCEGGLTIIRCGLIKAYIPRVLRTAKTEKKPFTKSSNFPDYATDGLRVAALVSKKLEIHYDKYNNPNYRYFVVDQIAPIDSEQALIPSDDQMKVFGYLKITGPNIENKHDERLFFSWYDQNNETDKKQIKKVSEESIKEYNRYLKKYWERHEENVEELNRRGRPCDAESLPHPSNFVKRGRKLEIGDLVYSYYDKAAGRIRLFPVSMPRVAYNNPREKLMPEYLYACTNNNDLCLACRLFGWVASKKETTKSEQEKIKAFSGILRFSNGTIKQPSRWIKADRSNPLILSILGSPKPTTTAFYLLSRKGEAEFTTNYNTEGARLRGRKFYRHHGIELFNKTFDKGEHEWEQPGRNPSKHNVTLKEVLDKDNTFTFSVDFENLASVELGALLWSLQLEEGWFHRLGYARPLGFGSLKIINVDLQIIDRNIRYKAFANIGTEKDDSTQEPELNSKESYVIKFKKAMERRYSVDFDKLDHYQDLKALIGKVPPLVVHYPRQAEKRDEKGEQFRWFVENKKWKKPLPLATDDVVGFKVKYERGE